MKKISLFLFMVLLAVSLWGYQYELPGGTQAKQGQDITGYIISVNDESSFLIDKGYKQGLQNGQVINIYSKDKIIKHPVTGKNITVMGEKIGEAVIKDVNDEYSTAEVSFMKNKMGIQPGYKIKAIFSESGKIRKKKKTSFKHKQETTVETTAYTGFFGMTPLLNETFAVGYKFPSRNIFNIEIQLAQQLYILNIYNLSAVNEYLVFAHGNVILKLDFWKENGGIGLAGGAGFSKSGFSGNVGVILGNMNRTGMSIYFFGSFDESIFTDVNLSIYINKYLNIVTKINYSYWFDSASITQGLLFTAGIDLKIKNFFYININGGFTNTLSSLFGGVGGLGVKFVL